MDLVIKIASKKLQAKEIFVRGETVTQSVIREVLEEFKQVWAQLKQGDYSLCQAYITKKIVVPIYHVEGIVVTGFNN